MPVIDIEYLKKDSPIHKLHPGTKIFFELAIFMIAAAFNDPIYLTILILFVIGIIWIAKIPVQKFRYMKIVAYVVLFLILTQGIWFTSFGDFGDIQLDSHTLFHLWPSWAPGGPRVPIVLEGLIYGLSLGLRLVAISLAFPILIITTHPSDLVTALSEVKIGKWRIPYNLIFVFTAALRFIPSVSREFDHTIDAQRSRGVEFGGFNVFAQMKAAVPLFVPVITSSLVHAQDLTIALETRAFGSGNERTIMHEVKWNRADWVIIIILLLLTIFCVIISSKYGMGLLPYTPQRNF